jgi:hypothetical protein
LKMGIDCNSSNYEGKEDLLMHSVIVSLDRS